MIYEIASLPVRADQMDAFTSALRDVPHLLTRAKGYEGHVQTVVAAIKVSAGRRRR
jgi:heme-degrading monooxygenase HmoA